MAFLAPVIAVATRSIVLDGIQIKADKDKIAADQARMSDLTKDVSALHLLAQNFSILAGKTVAIETNVQEILTEWKTLERDVNAAINSIKDAIKQADSLGFSVVLKDINDAIEEWNTGYKQAVSLKLDLQVNNAPLQLGMSSSEVQAALKTGKVVNLIDYCNRTAAAAA